MEKEYQPIQIEYKEAEKKRTLKKKQIDLAHQTQILNNVVHKQQLYIASRSFVKK